MSDDIFDDLDSQLDAVTEAWRPEPGEKLVGRVVELSEILGQYGVYPLVVLRTKDGSERAVHCFHSVIKAEIGRQKPAVGDMIAIKFLGKIDGKDYESYKVRVVHCFPATDLASSPVPIPEPPRLGLNFDQIAADAERELANS